MPGSDHDSLYRASDGKLTFVTEPYGIGHGKLKKTIDYCDKNGLKVEIDVGPPHFATHCLRITVRQANVPAC